MFGHTNFEEIGVLGAGIAGLTVGHQLGDNSLTLEKEDRVGGLARSFNFDDYIFDRGSHIIFSRDKSVLGWMTSVLDPNINSCNRNTKIYVEGDLVKYPFENDLASLKDQTRYECVIGYIDALIENKVTENSDTIENFEEWIYTTFGSGIADHYMMPYNKKVWCTEPKNMSAHWVDGRIPMPPAEDIIKSAMGLNTEGYTHQKNFYYPNQGGIEAFAQSIAQASESRINTEEEVIKIKKDKSAWQVITNEENYFFDNLYNTLPIYLLPKLMDLPIKVSNAIGNLKSNGAWLVMVGMEGISPPYSWMYFADDDILFNRISFPKNFSANTAPDGHYGILVEITCKVGSDIWNETPENIKNIVISQLLDTGIIEDKTQIDLVKATKTPLAYVIYDLDYQKNISIINNYMDKIGLVNVGRFAEFIYYNMDGVIKSAFEKTKLLSIQK